MKSNNTLKTVCDGRFVCLHTLGKGGEGTVYLAQDTSRQRLIALKEYPCRTVTAKRVEKEALRLKGLSHKGIPVFVGLFQENGRIYLAMEYMEGTSIKVLLEKKGLPGEKEVLRIASELCILLEYLHSQSPPVYYPDLKPSNILLDRNGAVSLIDFGADRVHTRGYAAPEQYLSDAAPDTRTDLYALGVTMHYLLTGKNPNHPPFTFENANKLNSKITKETSLLVERLLQPSRKRRLQSANEVQSQILQIRRVRKKRRSLRIMLTIAAVTLLLSAFTGQRSFSTALSAVHQNDQMLLSEEPLPSDQSAEESSFFSSPSLSFSLQDGSYETYQFLTVSYDPLYGNLYYTTDGSEPGTYSTPYQDGIVLSAPSQTIRVCQLGLDGERTEIEADYKITQPVEEIPLSPDRPLMWDIYYALQKSWTEPVFNYELARIRELPVAEIKEEDKWLLAYMPYLKK